MGSSDKYRDGEGSEVAVLVNPLELLGAMAF